MKQLKFYEQNDEIKQEIDSTIQSKNETENTCVICREGSNKQQLGICCYLTPDNLSHFYSPNAKISTNEEDIEATKFSINWISTTCNHFSHQECADANKDQFTHMAKNDLERVCTFCKSIFNLLLPPVSADLQLPEVQLLEEKNTKSLTIQDFELIISNKEQLIEELSALKKQAMFDKVMTKIDWFKNQIEGIILINIEELNQEGLDFSYESDFLQNTKDCLLFQFNQMFVKGLHSFLILKHYFLKNLFLCYCLQFQQTLKNPSDKIFNAVATNFTKLKTGEFLNLPLQKYEQFLSSLLLDTGILLLCTPQIFLQTTGIIYHLFISHLTSLYTKQLHSLHQTEQLQNYLLPFKRHVLGILLCLVQLPTTVLSTVINSTMLSPSMESQTYDELIKKILPVPTFSIQEIAYNNDNNNILSINPCKQPQFIIQLPDNFLDFHLSYLSKRCSLCNFYSKRNMGELHVCLLCGLQFCSACEKSKYVAESKNSNQILFAHANYVHLGQTIFVACETGKINLVDRKEIFEYDASLFVNSCGAPIKVPIIYQNIKNWELFKLDTKRINFFEHIAFSRKIVQQFGQEIADKRPQQCHIF